VIGGTAGQVVVIDTHGSGDEKVEVNFKPILQTETMESGHDDE